MITVGGVALAAFALAGCGPKVSDARSTHSPSAGPSSASPSAGTPGATGSPSTPGNPSATAPAPTGRPTAPATTVTLDVSGGFAGRSDRLTVAADGSWRYGNAKGQAKSGRLTADQRATLRRLVSDPKLAAEARYKQPKSVCNDGFVYKLTAGSVTMMRSSCGAGPDTPTFNAVVSLLTKATPL